MWNTKKWFRNPSIQSILCLRSKVTLILNKKCYLQKQMFLPCLKPPILFEIFLQLLVFLGESNISPLKESTSTASKKGSPGVEGWFAYFESCLVITLAPDFPLEFSVDVMKFPVEYPNVTFFFVPMHEQSTFIGETTTWYVIHHFL